MSEQFDEALVDRVAREVYGNTVVIHSGPHSHSMATAFLRAISKTHVILPVAEYERLRTIAALALSQPTGLDYGNPRKDDKEAPHV